MPITSTFCYSPGNQQNLNPKWTNKQAENLYWIQLKQSNGDQMA